LPRSPENYIEPAADVNVVKWFDANGNLFLEVFRRPGSDYDRLLRFCESSGRLIGLTPVKPFALDWKLAKAVSAVSATDEVFLLGDTVIKRVQQTSRGTYAGDKDDVCYNDDIVIVGEEQIGDHLITWTLDLYPEKGAFSDYCSSLRGYNGLRDAAKDCRMLADDPGQVWFRARMRH
jgi:hypothetical protein